MLEDTKTLRELRGLLAKLLTETVDDSEEILNALACEAEEYVGALDDAIEYIDKTADLLDHSYSRPE